MSNLRKNSDFDADRVKFRGTAKSITATANATTNLDLKITEERLFTGLQILANANTGDWAKLQVVDVDNVLGYGAGAILEEFVDKWFMDSNADNQGLFETGYPGNILANLYIRVEYHNTVVLAPVNLRVNYFLHKPLV